MGFWAFFKKYLVGLHFPPHFDFGYSKRKPNNSSGSQSSVTLYYIALNILCGLNLPKHLQE